MTELSQVVWRRSSRSGGNGSCVEVATVWRRSSRSTANGSCVEVAAGAETVAVRDSKDPHGPVLQLTGADWRAFLSTLPTR